MKILFILSFILTVSAPGGAQDKERDVVLDTGVKLHIKEILFSRILPTAYYDQAMASIPALYPDSEIVAARRFGRFGNNLASSYSMVCYKQSADVDEVTISGVVVSDRKAWLFDTKVNSSLFVDTLIRVLETVANLPSNHSLQSDPEPVDGPLSSAVRVHTFGLI
jgi:hypothetical protein